MTKSEPRKPHEVPADVVAHLVTAVKSWRAASNALTAHVETLSDPKRQADLRRVIRALKNQAVLLEQLVIAAPGA